MKIFLIIFSISLIISSCSSEVKEQETELETQNEVAETFDEKISYKDTTHSFSGLHDYYSFEADSYDTLISINQKKYRLRLESKLDPNMRILHNACFPEDDVLNCYSSVGYQGYYTFSLYDGEKQVFKRKLTKKDLKDAEYDLILKSGAFLPNLIEYNTVFEAFVFEIPFNAEGTCWASNALVLIGLDGKVKLVDQLSGTGGNSANRSVQITDDHSKLISADAIHFANGKSLSFVKDDANLMGVDLFDDCLLAVYQVDKNDHPKNAYLKDYKGKTLLNFNYEGESGGLGYSFIRKKVKDAYYFVDEVNKRLIRVKKVNNKWSYSNLPFSAMKEFDGNQRATEQMVDLSIETRDLIFYFDTNSGEIRKITPVEY